MENLKKLIWLSPKSHPGRNVMAVWGDYVKDLGWELFDENNINDAKVIFCGSESQIERAIDLKKKYPELFLICYCWGFPYFRLSSQSDWVKFYLDKINMLRECNVLIVPSSIGLLQLADWGSKSFIIEPGVDNKLIESVGPVEKQNQVVSVGRLVQHKRHDLLIYTIAKYHLNLEVVLIGSGEEKESLFEFAKKCDVKIRIESNLTDAEKIREIKKSVCLVSASEYEGFGMPVIEALTAGVPALIADMPFYRWYFRKGGTFFENEEELATLITDCMNYGNFAISIINRSKKMCDFFSFTNAAQRIGTFLGGVVSSVIKVELGKLAHQAKTNDELAEIYNLNFNREAHFHSEDFGSNRSDDSRADIVLKFLKSGSVLDLGCAHGAFTFRFAQEGFDVTAFDISKRMLELVRKIAKESNIKVLITDSIDNFSNCFDNVWIGEILEHVIDCNSFLKDCYRVLKQDGLLIGTVPYQQEWESPLHLRIFNAENLESLLKANNFNVQKIEFILNQANNLKNIFFLCTKNG